MTDLLTLTGWGQRATSYKFDLLDTQLVTVGELDVLGFDVQIENNINRTIKRQLNGLRISPTDAREINPLVHRVRPSMIMQDGVQWPLGVFVFSDISTSPMTGTDGFTVGTMMDQALTLDQPVNRVYGFRPGTSIQTAITGLLDASNIIEYEVDSSSSIVRGSEWVTWPAGTKLLEIINDLCGLASYYSLFFDNAGVARVKTVPDLDGVEPTLRYGSNVGEQRVHVDSIVETDDLLEAPNRYIVINSALGDQPVVGSWDIPASAPNSIVNRGFPVATVIDKQGVDTNAEAAAAAKAYGQADYSTYRWVTFDAAPDPRHDTFDVISWENVPYREQAWTLTLSAPGPHRHELRRIYNEIVDPNFVELS